jgi:tRNA(Ile2) C34 agmatinyltransferase TiaS
MNKLNWEIILSNIQEAKEELEKLENDIASSEKPDEVELELSLKHTYHHLNFAWNIRNLETEKYKNLTDTEFKKWSEFPKGFDGL